MEHSWQSVGHIAPHPEFSLDTACGGTIPTGTPLHKLGRLWKFLASEVDHWVKAGHAAGDVVTATRTATRRKLPRH